MTKDSGMLLIKDMGLAVIGHGKGKAHIVNGVIGDIEADIGCVCQKVRG